MSLNDEQIKNLLLACAETYDEEIDCDEFLARMASYAERRSEGGALSPELTLAERHERLCPTCREEYGALREAIDSAPQQASPL